MIAGQQIGYGASDSFASDDGFDRMDDFMVKRYKSMTIVRLGTGYGSLDTGAAEELENRLLRLTAEIEPPYLLLDCRATACFGSLFIRVLMRCYKRLQSRRGKFGLYRLTSQLRQEIHFLNLDLLWPIYGSLAAAAQGMGSRSSQESQHDRQQGPYA
jgi:anti-sigma B factor antagonist